MPSVWIEKPCSDPEDMPKVCMRCGAEATLWKKRHFDWMPPWVIITLLAALPVYIILSIVLRKQRKVAVPLCAKHKNHWLTRGLLVAGTFFLFIPGSIGLTVLTVLLTEGSGMEGLGALWIPAGIVGWLVFIVVANYTAIRPREITDHGIKLTNVCAEFAEAYREMEEREKKSFPREAYDRWDDRRGDRPRREGDRYRGDDEDRRGKERYRDDY